MYAQINQTLERMAMALNPVFRSERASQSKQLEEFRNRDFRSMPTELGKLIVADRALMEKGLRYFNITGKASDDLAIQYSVPCQRRFTDVSETQAKRWVEVYDGLGVNDVLAEGERQTVAQQSLVYGCWPDSKGKLRLTRFLPYQIDEIVFRDPWAALSGDLQDADRIVLCLPAFYPADTYQPGPTSQWVAKVTLTPDEAYVEFPDSKRFGLFNPDGTNPLGFVPVVGTRRALPLDSVDWIPELSQDLLSVQIGVNLGLSDVEHIMRQETTVTVYATGLGAKLINRDKVKKLAGGLIPIPDQTTLVPITTNPPVEKYIMAIDRMIGFFAQFRTLRPEGYTGLTGVAKAVDMFALEQERLRQENRLRALERGLVRLIARVRVLTERSALTPEEPGVDVSYVYPRTRENVLQEAQALPLLMANGLVDAVEEIAANEKVDLVEAERRWTKRMERWREMVAAGALSAPGLDKIGSQLDKNGARVTMPGDAKPATKPAAGQPGEASTATGDVQKTALNGAQVTALQGVIMSVAAGQIPIEAAREVILASFDIDESDVDRMLAPLEGFEPKEDPDARREGGTVQGDGGERRDG